MLIPFATRPTEVKEFDPEFVKNGTLKCMHGNTVKLRDCLVAYTHKDGETDADNGYYAFCKQECYLHCVTGGSA